VWTNDYDMRKTLLNLPCICVCVHCLLSEFYTTKASVIITEAVNSYFHLYGCGYHISVWIKLLRLQVYMMRRMIPCRITWSTTTKACRLSGRGVRLG
jgi:hypothetical protein